MISVIYLIRQVTYALFILTLAAQIFSIRAMDSLVPEENIPHLEKLTNVSERFTHRMLNDGVREGQTAISLLTLKVAPKDFLMACYERDTNIIEQVLRGRSNKKDLFLASENLIFLQQYLSVLVFGEPCFSSNEDMLSKIKNTRDFSYFNDSEIFPNTCNNIALDSSNCKEQQEPKHVGNHHASGMKITAYAMASFLNISWESKVWLVSNQKLSSSLEYKILSLRKDLEQLEFQIRVQLTDLSNLLQIESKLKKQLKIRMQCLEPLERSEQSLKQLWDREHLPMELSEPAEQLKQLQVEQIELEYQLQKHKATKLRKQLEIFRQMHLQKKLDFQDCLAQSKSFLPNAHLKVSFDSVFLDSLNKSDCVLTYTTWPIRKQYYLTAEQEFKDVRLSFSSYLPGCATNEFFYKNFSTNNSDKKSNTIASNTDEESSLYIAKILENSCQIHPIFGKIFYKGNYHPLSLAASSESAQFNPEYEGQ